MSYYLFSKVTGTGARKLKHKTFFCAIKIEVSKAFIIHSQLKVNGLAEPYLKTHSLHAGREKDHQSSA